MRYLRQFEKFRWRHGIASLALAQALAIPVMTISLMTTPAAAQTTAASGTGNAAKGIDEGEYSLIDVGDFVGWQWYQIYQGTSTPSTTRLNAGIGAGARVTENLWRYISLEQTFTFGSNRLEMLPAGNQWYAKIAENNYTIAALVDINLTPRDAKFRPYVFLGPGYMIYHPAGGIGSINAPSPGVSTPDIGNSVDMAFLYGVGVKINWARRADIRFDAIGKISGEPHFQLPAVPVAANGLYSPSGGRENSIMASIGVDFRLGLHEPPPPVVAAPPPPPPPPPPVQVGAITGARTVCAGDSLELQVSATGGSSRRDTYVSVDGGWAGRARWHRNHV